MWRGQKKIRVEPAIAPAGWVRVIPDPDTLLMTPDEARAFASVLVEVADAADRRRS